MGAHISSRKHSGTFLAVEGPDGVGKSTLVQGLAARIRQETQRSLLLVREPGSTPRGEEYRRILLGDAAVPLDRREELFLYCASRVAMLEQHVRPALQAGKIVMTDRFALSTYAYQGGEGGVADSDIQDVVRVAVGDLWPDLTLVLTLEAEALRARMEARPGPKDRIEREEGRLRSAVDRYRGLLERVPGTHEISAAGSPEEVQQRAWEVVAPYLGLEPAVLARGGECRPQFRRGR